MRARVIEGVAAATLPLETEPARPWGAHSERGLKKALRLQSLPTFRTSNPFPHTEPARPWGGPERAAAEEFREAKARDKEGVAAPIPARIQNRPAPGAAPEFREFRAWVKEYVVAVNLPSYISSPRARIALPDAANLSFIQQQGSPGTAPEVREFRTGLKKTLWR